MRENFASVKPGQPVEDLIQARATTVRERIVVAARAWIGTPYRLTGRDRTGVDCCNFPFAVLRELELLDYRPPPYRKVEENELFQLFARTGLSRISPVAARPGDLLVFRAYAWNCHPALRSENGVIHCPAAPVIEQPVRSIGGHAVAAYRVPGID